MSNQQPDILEMAMEEVGFKDDETPEKTPDSSNRNAEIPYGSKFLDDSSNPFDNDLPTPGIDENIENNPQDTENIPVNTENFPGNLGNNPLENEVPPSSTNEDIENNYQGTGNIPVNTENVPDNPGSTPLENFSSQNPNAEKPYGSKSLDDCSNPFDNDLPTPGIDENIENNPQEWE